MNPIRVLLADDHTVVREGLRWLLDAQPDIRVVGEAGDGVSAARTAAAVRPDVAVIDLSMPGNGGAWAAAEIRRTRPEVRVLMLTVHEDPTYVRQALEVGAGGYLLKRAAGDDLVRAVRAVAAGETYLDPALVGGVVDQFLGRGGADAAPGPELSPREADVLRRVALGFSNKEIAAALDVSVKTVETYKARSMEKLALRSRVDVVRFAARSGWLTGE